MGDLHGEVLDRSAPIVGSLWKGNYQGFSFHLLGGNSGVPGGTMERRASSSRGDRVWEDGSDLLWNPWDGFSVFLGAGYAPLQPSFLAICHNKV